MRYAAVLSLCLLSASGFGAEASVGIQDRDVTLIRQVQSEQARAWNRHDGAAYAALFTPAGDVVNVMGWWWKGRAEIQIKLDGAFKSVFRESSLAIVDTEVRFLSAEIAIAHVRWTMAGAMMPPGMPLPREGIQLQVLRKQSGHWLIESFQNMNSIPERPFPAGPPVPSRSP